jgi:pyruvate/2-oxoglutarate dehydrogenase complex dihydrolipoamide acyltransferase (E2) component
MNANASRIELVAPDLGVPSVGVGVWYAQLGDHVYHGDRLVEVIVNGATFDVTAPATGTLIERSVLTRDRVGPGKVLGAVLADSE